MVPAPDDKGVVKNAAVHAHRAVQLGIHNGGGADDHTVGQIMVFTALGHMPRQTQIVGVELRKTVRKRHIAGTDLAVLVLHNGIDGNRIVFEQLPSHRKHIKLLDFAGGLADAEAQQHIEFHPAPAAKANQRRNIQRFEKGYHGVGRVHPKGISLRAGSRFRVDHSRFHCARSNPAESPA